MNKNATGNKRRTLALVALCCGLVLAGGAALTATGIRAYLTDTDTATNTFTVGEVKIDTLEPNYPGNGSDEVRDLNSLEEVPKDPQIRNTGKNRAVVYTRIDIPMKNLITAQPDGTRNPAANTEVFEYRTEPGEFNSTHSEWVLIDTDYLTEDGVETSKETAAKVSRLYGYSTVLEEDETTVPVFDVVRLTNIIEDQIDNTVQEIVITSYAIQAENIAGLTDAHYDNKMGAEMLTNIFNVYMNQSGEVEPDDADTSNSQTVIDSTLNITFTVKNTHLKLNTGNDADTKTTTEFKVAYTGSGVAPTPTFESSQPGVATVDQSGNIQAVGVGSTVITMKAVNPDTGHTAEATVTVYVRDVNQGE